MTDLRPTPTRGDQLDSALTALLASAPEIEAAAVVTVDGLAMASALPESLDEDRVAAMSAALLSLGERAAAGLGRGELSQVFIEGQSGTVFLVSAEGEAVLVAVAAAGAKTGLMLFEVRRTAAVVAAALREETTDTARTAPSPAAPEPAPEPVAEPDVFSALSEQAPVAETFEPVLETFEPAAATVEPALEALPAPEALDSFATMAPLDSFASVAPPWEGTALHVAETAMPSAYGEPLPAVDFEPVPAPWADGVDGAWAPSYAPTAGTEAAAPIEAEPAPWQ